MKPAFLKNFLSPSPLCSKPLLLMYSKALLWAERTYVGRGVGMNTLAPPLLHQWNLNINWSYLGCSPMIKNVAFLNIPPTEPKCLYFVPCFLSRCFSSPEIGHLKRAHAIFCHVLHRETQSCLHWVSVTISNWWRISEAEVFPSPHPKIPEAEAKPGASGAKYDCTCVSLASD